MAEISSLFFEILVDIQNDIFGDCVIDLLWCCHNETQTRNEARNCFFMIVLGTQMCMHLGVYKLKSHLSCNSFCVLIHKNKIKKIVLPLGFELGIA